MCDLVGRVLRGAGAEPEHRRGDQHPPNRTQSPNLLIEAHYRHRAATLSLCLKETADRSNAGEVRTPSATIYFPSREGPDYPSLTLARKSLINPILPAAGNHDCYHNSPPKAIWAMSHFALIWPISCPNWG